MTSVPLPPIKIVIVTLITAISSEIRELVPFLTPAPDALWMPMIQADPGFLTDIHKCLRIIQRRSVAVLNHILHKGSFQDKKLPVWSAPC